MVVGQSQWNHFGAGALPILVYYSWDWDVHWGSQIYMVYLYTLALVVLFGGVLAALYMRVLVSRLSSGLVVDNSLRKPERGSGQ